jgi:thiamine biosynthesis lipoprotein
MIPRHKKTNRLLLQVSLLAFFFAIALLISTHWKKGEYTSFMGFTQGTSYHITYESRKGEQLQSQVDSLLAEFDTSLSIYNPKSIISRFNRNEEGVLADERFTEVFNKSAEVNKKTDGAFDITVGPIVNAFGFGSGDTLNLDSAMIDSLRLYVGMQKVRLENGMLIKSDPHVTLDVNALAQGYSVDVVCAFLDHRKIKNYLVEIGGEVRAKGKNEAGVRWRVGIDKPEEGNNIPGTDLEAIISLKDRSLATSGNYRKYYVKNGIKYVHTIDPHTGYPVISNLLSATIVSKDCMTADAYATACMVIGVEKSTELLKNNKFLEGYLIYADEKGNFRIYVTPGLKKFISE